MSPSLYTKDGKVRPITPKKSGAAAVATAAAVGGLLATGGFGGAGSMGTAADSLVAKALHGKITHSKIAARSGQRGKAWKRLGMRRHARDFGQALECAANSYGEVRDFFLRNHCRTLDRSLLVLGDGNDNTILVSVAWIQMHTAGDAMNLRALADTNGTGNVAALGSVGPLLGNVRFTGEFYDSRRRGRMTVIAEAAPADGTPGPALMDAATQVAVLFPLP